MTYSGWKGGEKYTTVEQIARAAIRRTSSRTPCKGMMPKNRLGRVLLTKLKVFKGPKHPHAAQKPEAAQGGGLIRLTFMNDMATKTNEFLGTGRRKTAIARVRLATGSGKITVNGRAFDNYFPLETQRATATQPLTVTGTADKFDVRVNVTGGGPNGQAGAVRHGIARALLQFDATLRPLLKAEGLLTRDPRMKERKKYGQPGARKRFQYSKR